MKKKVKDLQSEDIYRLCSQQQVCEECPLFKVFPFRVFCFAIPAFTKILKDSSNEIEIPEEEQVSEKIRENRRKSDKN